MICPVNQFSSPSAAALGEQYFKKSVCGFVSLCVDNAFLLCLTSFYYLNEWSDTKLVNPIFVKTAEPHQAALDINSKVVWLRSKWGLKLTYFSNFAILGMFRTS